MAYKPKVQKPKFCKYCKIPFTPQYTSLQPCCTISCTVKYNRALKELKDSKELDKTVKGMKINTHTKEYRNSLQNETNKLARKIDELHGFTSCIDDCGNGYGSQTDGAHFHGVGSNNSIRYNLHNIHSASSQCNFYSDKHKQGYEIGLQKRYGLEYFERIVNLPIKYKEIKLSNMEVIEKLKVVRLLIRTAHTFKFDSAINARDHFNKIIGIYT